MNRLEELLNKLDPDELGDVLRVAKNSLALSNATWADFTKVVPRISKAVELYEKLCNETINLDRLEDWLVNVKKSIDQQKQLIPSISAHGLDSAVWTLINRTSEMSINEIGEVLGDATPQTKLLKTIYGPNWFSRFDEINHLQGATFDKFQIPLDCVKGRLEGASRDIVGLWSTLQDFHKNKGLDSFREKWERMQRWERSSWIQKVARLHEHPNWAFHQLAQRGKYKSPDKKAFLSPLLNVEDLVQTDVLPTLLQVRSTTHPKLFLIHDAQFVNLGYWFKILAPLKITGRVSFLPFMDGETRDYNIRFESNALDHPEFQNPAIGIYQLMAQKEMYEFLISCCSHMHELEEPCAFPLDVTSNDVSPTLLDRSALSRYGRPDYVDWRFLKSMLDSTAEEALDDLWQLRTNPEYWDMRMANLKNTSSFLRFVFGRLDVLLTVSQQLDEWYDNGWKLEIQSCVNLNQIQGMLTMYFVLRSILSDTLASVNGTTWSPKEGGNETCCFLFDLLRKNDPTLHVMGLGAVLRTIEREIQPSSSPEPVPFLISQALHDISVLTTCMQEVFKCYNFLENLGKQHAIFADDVQTRWNNRERPWVVLIENALKGLHGKLSNLNSTVGDKTIPVDHRHRVFWINVDECMRKFDNTNPLLCEIFKHGPAPEPSTSTTVFQELGTHVAELNPTRTQIKKARGKPPPRPDPVPQPQVPSLAPPASTWPHELPTLYIRRQEDRDFWHRLKTEKGQVAFNEWEAFLGNLGYSSLPQGGSGHRFEAKISEKSSHVIVYHDLHGGKITHAVARGIWADRLEKRVHLLAEVCKREEKKPHS